MRSCLTDNATVPAGGGLINPEGPVFSGVARFANGQAAVVKRYRAQTVPAGASLDQHKSVKSSPWTSGEAVRRNVMRHEARYGGTLSVRHLL
jgi:hypothetical protein